MSKVGATSNGQTTLPKIELLFSVVNSTKVSFSILKYPVNSLAILNDPPPIAAPSTRLIISFSGINSILEDSSATKFTAFSVGFIVNTFSCNSSTNCFDIRPESASLLTSFDDGPIQAYCKDVYPNLSVSHER